jgi:hypothetical protein
MLGVLIASYPAFRISYGFVGRRRCRWVAERVNGQPAQQPIRPQR